MSVNQQILSNLCPCVSESFDNLLHSYNPSTRPMDRASMSDVLESLPDGVAAPGHPGSNQAITEPKTPPKKPVRKIPTVCDFLVIAKMFWKELVRFLHCPSNYVIIRYNYATCYL